jgi:putative transposase
MGSSSGSTCRCTIAIHCSAMRFGRRWPAAGVQTVRLPPRSPNLTAFAERFVRTIKESCLDRVILMGEASLRRAIREIVAHYNDASYCLTSLCA